MSSGSLQTGCALDAAAVSTLLSLFGNFREGVSAGFSSFSLVAATGSGSNTLAFFVIRLRTGDSCCAAFICASMPASCPFSLYSSSSSMLIVGKLSAGSSSFTASASILLSVSWEAIGSSSFSSSNISSSASFSDFSSSFIFAAFAAAIAASFARRPLTRGRHLVQYLSSALRFACGGSALLRESPAFWDQKYGRCTAGPY
mmetsp:Transcript_58997/g.140874  ORF Transcript_58997/g.140874 Transcript_58997/m.140874 type:complete len:201 (+) Transcript_58997:105-707(+)